MSFSKNCVFPQNWWASAHFDRSILFFDRSKFFNFDKREPLFVSINRNSWNMFLKKSDWTFQRHFFKKFFQTFLSLRLGKASLKIFCHFSLKFLQGFSFTRPVRPLYPSFCFYFHDFMHKLMHFKGIFRTFQIWDFCWINPLFLKLIFGFCFYIWYIHDICWLIWSIWGFVNNLKF